MTADHSGTAAVVLAIDRGYVGPAIVTLRSLADHRGAEAPHVWVLGHGLFKEDTRQLLDEADRLGLPLSIREVDQDLTQYDVQLHLSSAAWIRVLIPELCPELDRALYLDADLIVLRDLTPLLELQLGQSPLAAVQDYGIPELGTAHLAEPPFDLSTVNPRTKYFNSGVMVMNLPRWRELRLTERVLDFGRAASNRLRFADQDALNGVIAGDWTELDRRWNVLPLTEIMQVLPFDFLGEPYLSLEQVPALEEGAYIMHYATPLKPWQNRYPAGVNRDRFTRYARSEPAVTAR
ncbi:glycosyltransferase family 8 protein [Streptomyces sp. NPDC001536]|uniref:glycosyltransferase family 8 protein n=1 Tax=Streptomyces sp. NPDC001536 TaxID=3364583 RepID=UPI00368CE089